MRLREKPEPAGCNFKVVVTWRHVCNPVAASLVGVRFPRNTCSAVGDNYVRFRNCRAALVCDRAAYRTIKNLSVGTMYVSQRQEAESKQISHMNAQSTCKHRLCPFPSTLTWPLVKLPPDRYIILQLNSLHAGKMSCLGRFGNSSRLIVCSLSGWLASGEIPLIRVAFNVKKLSIPPTCCGNYQLR